MGETLSNQIGQMLTDPVPWLWHTGDGHGDSHLPLRGQKGPSGALALGRTRGGEGLGVHCGHLSQEGLLLLGHPGPEMSVFTIHITVLRSLCHHHHHKHLCPTQAPFLKWANASHRQTLFLCSMALALAPLSHPPGQATQEPLWGCC